MLKDEKGEEDLESKESPVKDEIISHDDYRFDTFNNNDFGIAMFDKDNFESNYNTCSNQNSIRNHSKSKEEKRTNQNSQISGSFDNSNSTFRI